MILKLEFLENEKIILRKFIGEISFPELLDSWKYLVENNLICNDCIGILNDFTEAKFNMQIENLGQLLEYFNNNIGIFSRIKLAVIMVRPDDTVFPLLAKIEYPQFKIEAFCTIEAATKWILN